MADQRSATPPAILPDPDSEHYWNAARQRRLDIQFCSACERLTFPPKPACPQCLAPLQWRTMSGKGQVYSYCIARLEAVSGFKAPYAVAWVSLREQEDIRITANILDCPIEDVRIDMAVEVDFVERPGGEVIPQFRRARPKDNGS